MRTIVKNNVCNESKVSIIPTSVIRIVLSLYVFALSSNVVAQDHILDNGYIYSEDGFVCKILNDTTYSWGDRYITTALFTADMKVMVKPPRFFLIRNVSMVIPDGIEVIPSNFLVPEFFPKSVDVHSTWYEFNHRFEYYIRIPASVKYIAPDAFNTVNVAFLPTDESEQSSINAPKKMETETDLHEVSRYNVAGVKINEPQKGINIVQMSNSTIKKELIK